MSAELNHPTWVKNLNTKFSFAGQGVQPIELQLIEISEFNQSDFQERFSIVFRGPLEVLLPQGIYTVEHDQMGAFDLFIVPISKRDDGYHYEAVFNRLRK